MGTSDAKALEVIDAFIASFNAGDLAAHLATLNFPHVRIAGGRVSVWQDAAEMGKALASDLPKRIEPDWHHSVFDSKEIIHTSAAKVHVAVQFTRYDQRGAKIATYQAVYVVTCLDGHWGIQARSSFAP